MLSTIKLGGLLYAVILGGLTMFVQSIGTAVAALYRGAHHSLFVSYMDSKKKLPTVVACNLFINLCFKGVVEAT